MIDMKAYIEAISSHSLYLSEEQGHALYYYFNNDDKASMNYLISLPAVHSYHWSISHQCCFHSYPGDPIRTGVSSRISI